MTTAKALGARLGINDAPALAQADVGVAMSFSSVSVIGNALRLRRTRV